MQLDSPTSTEMHRIHIHMESSSVRQRVEEALKPANAPDELSRAEQQMVQELKQVDRQVRSHEQAHKAAGGGYVTGGPSYTFQTGPDGRQYAIGGEVDISTSEVPGDPEATLKKMEKVRQAALAPSHPSPQDQRVATQAASKAAEARIQLQQQKHEEQAAEEAQSGNTAEGAGSPSARTVIQSYRDAKSPFGSGQLLNLTA